MSTQLELAMVYGNAHNHFLAGDLMTGTVVVEVAEKIRIREFYAEIKCEANAGWTSLASDKIYESTEVIKELQACMVHGALRVSLLTSCQESDTKPILVPK